MLYYRRLVLLHQETEASSSVVAETAGTMITLSGRNYCVTERPRKRLVFDSFDCCACPVSSVHLCSTAYNQPDGDFISLSSSDDEATRRLYLLYDTSWLSAR